MVDGLIWCAYIKLMTMMGSGLGGRCYPAHSPPDPWVGGARCYPAQAPPAQHTVLSGLKGRSGWESEVGNAGELPTRLPAAPSFGGGGKEAGCAWPALLHPHDGALCALAPCAPRQRRERQNCVGLQWEVVAP